MSTLVRCASATAARASRRRASRSESRLFSGEPSSSPACRTAKDPPCGVPNAPDRLRLAFLPAVSSALDVRTTSRRRRRRRLASFTAASPRQLAGAVASSRSPTSRSHLCHAGAARSITSASASVASARVMPASLGASSDTYMSPSRFPPRKPPHVNTRGPTPADGVPAPPARRRRRVLAPAWDPPTRHLGDGPPRGGPRGRVQHRERTASRPPCSRRRARRRSRAAACPTKDTACWYRAVGASPGAAAHSQRPSRCLREPEGVREGRGVRAAAAAQEQQPVRASAPRRRTCAGGGTSPAGFILTHSYGLLTWCRGTTLSPRGLLTRRSRRGRPGTAARRRR